MSKRALAVLAILLAGSGLPGGPAPAAQPAPERPNIILVLVDDLDRGSLQHMPRVLDLIAGEGVELRRFFVNLALCCPARATVLRGQYAHNHGIVQNNPPDGGFETFTQNGLDTSTVATWLQDSGYDTALIGKYLNGYGTPESRVSPTYVPPGWTRWFAPIGPDPYEGFDYVVNDDGTLTSYGSNEENYVTDVLADEAEAFVRASSDVPFFLHLATFTPHQPATPAPRHKGLFQGVRYPRVPSFNEPDVGDKPKWVRNKSRLTSDQIAEIDRLHRSRLRSLQSIDEMVGRLISILEAQGELDETYVFFTTDHGYHMGEHRLNYGKNSPYDEDIRVPLLVRGPEAPAGTVVKHIALNTDLAPTFAKLAGVDFPDFVDGRSMVPLLDGQKPTRGRQAILIRRTRSAADYVGIRTKRYLYVEYRNGEREFYDIKSDRWQLTNTYAEEDEALTRALANLLDDVRTCARTECRESENQKI